MLIGATLVPVRTLLNGATIRRVATASVHYWHLETDRDDAVLAEGLPAETYLDTGNRDALSTAAPEVTEWTAAHQP